MLVTSWSLGGCNIFFIFFSFFLLFLHSTLKFLLHLYRVSATGCYAQMEDTMLITKDTRIWHGSSAMRQASPLCIPSVTWRIAQQGRELQLSLHDVLQLYAIIFYFYFLFPLSSSHAGIPGAFTLINISNKENASYSLYSKKKEIVYLFFYSR